MSGIGPDGDCANINGTYVLPWDELITTACHWRLNGAAVAPCFASGTGQTINIVAIVEWNAFGGQGPGWYLQITLEQLGTFGQQVLYDDVIGLDQGTPPDCSTWNNLAIPFRSDTSCCTHDTTAALITAL